MASLMAMAYSTMAIIPATSSCKKDRAAIVLSSTANNHKSPSGNLKPAAPALVFPSSTTSGGVRALTSSSKKGCICKASANNGGLLNDNVLHHQLNEEDAADLQYYPDHKPYNVFPRDFVFGAASAAYQVEGATKEGGRAPSIWDTFCKSHPEKIVDRSSGDRGAGSYHHYKDDVKLLKDIGLKAYRFSISWSRVLPSGRGEPNPEGIQYYNNLIDELKKNGIEPYVTLFHWDVPQALEDEYDGFLSRRIVEDYKNYVDLCFNKFGDRVKHWITMNEPYMFSTLGYCVGTHAPGRCTPGLKVGEKDYVCPVGDSTREPYKVAHNILLAHSEAFHLYKDKYKAKFGGNVGITLVSHWFEPYNNQASNIEAQARALDFMLGWFLDPLKFGDYPFFMRTLVGERLPTFTPKESAKLKDSFDFVGLNYYTARYARDNSNSMFTVKINSCYDDQRADLLVANKDDVAIGPAQPKSWVHVYPNGLKKLLLHIKKRYGNPPVYITENGVLKYNESNKLREEHEEANKPREESEEAERKLKKKILYNIEDMYRSEYHVTHLQVLQDAMSIGADVRGYFVWSLLDSFEWVDGYTCHFGLHYRDVDHTILMWPVVETYVKQSAIWLRGYLKNIVYIGEWPPSPGPTDKLSAEIVNLPSVPQTAKIQP